MAQKVFNDTRNITSEDVEDTLKYLSPIVGVSYNSMVDKKGNITEYGLEDSVIGLAEKNSAGMYGRKANIDRISIAVGEGRDPDKVIARLVRKIGPENVGKPMYGGTVIPAKIPVGGKETNGFVETQLVMGNNDLLRFTHREPDPELMSEYDNTARNELVRAVLMDMRRSIRDPETKEVVALVGPAYYNDRGIVNQWRHFPVTEDGTRSKRLAPISRSEFMELYPDYAGKEKEMVVSSPREIVDFIFPNLNVKEDDFDSYESVRDLVIEHKPDRAESIFNLFAQNMQRRGQTVPEGLIMETVEKVEKTRVLREVREISFNMVSESLVKRGRFNEFRKVCTESLPTLKNEDYFAKPKINADIMPTEGVKYLIDKCGMTEDWDRIRNTDYGTNYHHRVNDLSRFYEEFCELLGEEDFFSVTEHYDLKMTPESFLYSVIGSE